MKDKIKKFLADSKKKREYRAKENELLGEIKEYDSMIEEIYDETIKKINNIKNDFEEELIEYQESKTEGEWGNFVVNKAMLNERGDKYECNGCEHEWKTKNHAGKSTKCPSCNTTNITNTDFVERQEGIDKIENLFKKFKTRELKIRKKAEIKLVNFVKWYIKTNSIKRKEAISNIRELLDKKNINHMTLIDTKETKTSSNKSKYEFVCFSCDKLFNTEDLDRDDLFHCPYCNSVNVNYV